MTRPRDADTLPDVAARLYMRAPVGAPRARCCVILAADPAGAVPEALTTPGRVAAVVAHDAGATWPDRDGAALVRAVVDAGGTAALAFANLADALACKRRLDAEGGRSGSEAPR